MGAAGAASVFGAAAGSTARTALAHPEDRPSGQGQATQLYSPSGRSGGGAHDGSTGGDGGHPASPPTIATALASYLDAEAAALDHAGLRTEAALVHRLVTNLGG